MSNVLVRGSKNLSLENWKVFNAEGRHMFTCGEKKSEWYLERGLAKVTGKNEITFTFTPNGHGFEDNEDFGRSVREARCVVSGETKSLQKHHIIPYCYRTHFPEEYKSKNHHDVVLINHNRHSDYELIANQFKDEIAKIYGIKTIQELNYEYVNAIREIGKEYSIIINNLHSIFFQYNKLSKDDLLSKFKLVSSLTNISESQLMSFTYIQLYKLMLHVMDIRSEKINEFKTNNRKHYDHGYHLFQKLDSQEKIEHFISLWRIHFIENANPKFMPEGWSIDFRKKTSL